MSQPLTRRTFLRGAGAAGAVAAAGTLRPVRRAAAAEPDPSLAPFVHGVASGDPRSDRVVLWTRVTPPDGHDGRAIPVQWVVATDPDLVDVVARGATTANPERDWTVKIDPDGLAPRTTYFYGFQALGQSSLTGRTRTAPAPAQAVDRLRFGVVSCANFQGGFFNVYARVAEHDDLDAVVHLGDYIYDYGNGEYQPGAGELSSPRPMEPPTEILSLEDYRLRHGTHKLDPDLMLLHQRHPMIVTWDDHESANNSYRDGAENHDPDEGEGDWGVRKRASARAYDEWMPLRLDDPSDTLRIHRTLSYGDLVDIVVMDTRLEGRDEIVGEQGATIVSGEEIDDPERQMISDRQRQQVFEALDDSSARWKLVAQQVMMAQLNAGGLPSADELGDAAGAPDFPAFLLRDGGNALNPDQWDGYTAERDRFFANVRDNEVGNLVVLTGDIHTSWAIELTEDPYDPAVYDPTGANPAVPGNIGVEFVTPSVTSANFEEFGEGPTEAMEAGVQADNPHIRYVDLTAHGYYVLDLSDEAAQADFFHVDTVLEPSDAESFDQGWLTRDGQNHLEEASQAAPAGQAQPRPPSDPPGNEQPAPDPPAPTPEAQPGADPSPAAPAPSPSLPATGAGSAALGATAIGAAGLLARRSRRARGSDPGGTEPE